MEAVFGSVSEFKDKSNTGSHEVINDGVINDRESKYRDSVAVLN